MKNESADSHLTNWGILSSIFAGEYLKDTFFNDVKFNYTYCSPLIRTWETAACMFSDKYNTFTVAPYLSEVRKDEKKPFQYETNIKRFEEFVNYVSSTSDNSMKYLIQNLNRDNIINKQIESIKKFKISCTNNFSKIHLEKTVGNLENFIDWFIKNNSVKNKKINVVVICHNNLMMNFLEKHYRYAYYKHNILETNNFSFKVTVKKNIIGHPVIFFLGIKNPIGNEDNIDVNCSLCVKNRKCLNKNSDKNIHMKLIKNSEQYFFN